MKIELHEIPVREVAEGYVDSAENGVRGFGGRLNIRPAFQREFIYRDRQRDEVIRTVRRNFPLNVMYWVKGADGGYEVLDGQQRTISLCQYVQGDFSIDHQGFANLTPDERRQILDYPLMVYVCEGSDREKLDWFKIINIAGERLTDQELRNAVYAGEWLHAAKKYFSKTGCPAALLDDEDVTNQRGIYEYLLDGDARHLSIRAFTPRMARTAYERQKGVCPKCGKAFALEAMQADHITPWSKGGRTVAENCQMLCADCNRRKSDV